MKKIFLMCIVVSTGLSSSFAAERRAKNSSSDTISTSSSAADKSNFRFGIGAATYSPTSASPSLVALFHFDQRNTLQPMFGIAGTSGTFLFSMGAIYRHAMALGNNAGFHIGGSFGVGTASGGSRTATVAAGATPSTNHLVITMGGVAGIQYHLPGTDDLVMYLDAGPQFGIDDGDANFAIGPFSAIFGATIVYLF
jgi:hypothetical protein